jgi:hypothetical protein
MVWKVLLVISALALFAIPASRHLGAADDVVGGLAFLALFCCQFTTLLSAGRNRGFRG